MRPERAPAKRTPQCTPADVGPFDEAYLPTSATGRNRRADQTSSIDTCITGRQPAPENVSQPTSRVRSVATLALRLG